MRQGLALGGVGVGQHAHAVWQAIAGLDVADGADVVSGAGPVPGLGVDHHQAHRVAHLEASVVAAHLGSLGARHQVSQWRRVNLQNVLIAHDQYSVGALYRRFGFGSMAYCLPSGYDICRIFAGTNSWVDSLA